MTQLDHLRSQVWNLQRCTESFPRDLLLLTTRKSRRLEFTLSCFSQTTRHHWRPFANHFIKSIFTGSLFFLTWDLILQVRIQLCSFLFPELKSSSSILSSTFEVCFVFFIFNYSNSKNNKIITKNQEVRIRDRRHTFCRNRFYRWCASLNIWLWGFCTGDDERLETIYGRDGSSGHFLTLMPSQKKKKNRQRERQTEQPTTGFHPAQDISVAPRCALSGIVTTSRFALRALLQTSAVRRLVFRIKYNLCSFHSASFTCTWVHVYFTPVTALTERPEASLSQLSANASVTSWHLHKLMYVQG